MAEESSDFWEDLWEFILWSAEIIIKATWQSLKLEFKSDKPRIGLTSFFLIFITVYSIIKTTGDIKKDFPWLNIGILIVISFFVGIMYNILRMVWEDYKIRTEYKFIEQTKRVAIYRDHHGIVQYGGIVKSLNKNFEKLDTLWFSLGESAKKGTELKDFQILKNATKVDAKSRFTEQTFFYKIIAIDGEPVEICAKDGEDGLTVQPVKEIGDNSKKKIGFIVKFPRGLTMPNNAATKAFTKGSKMEFWYGWSSYDLFPISKEEVESGWCEKRPDGAHAETHFVVEHPSDKLNFVISFEHGIKISKIQIRNSEKILGDLQRVGDLYYSKYVYTVQRPILRKRYTVQWEY